VAHIGVLKAFEEESINIEYISGTSSGSIVATLWAAGYSYEEIYLLFKKYSHKIKYLDLKNILSMICGVVIKRKIVIKGLNSGRVIEDLINDACAKKGIYNVKQIKMPLLIPSVDLHTGKVYCFCSKEVRRILTNEIEYINDAKIGKVVRASCSYPAIFEPCGYQNLELVDGGLRENVPWRETKKIGADKVISVVFEKELKEKCCNNIIDVVSHSIDILTSELSNYELDGADYLLRIKTKEISLLDMNKLEYLYYLGYQTAKTHITEIKSITN